MSDFYHDRSRELQDRYDIADRMEERLVADRIGDVDRAFIESRDMRLSGKASIAVDDPWLAGCPEAQFIVRIAVTKVFPNCPRYIHRFALVERSPYIPHAGSPTPVPNWKKSDWASDVLPKDDPARDG